MPCCLPPEEAWVRRAQLWLGTLVEVALPAAQASAARFDAAFAAVAHVHQRLHPHARGSDLRRIARAAHHGPVRIHRQSHELLALAQQLWRDSGGLFDPSLPARGGASLAALRLLPARRVRSTAALRLDLGGIAKGHAVDRAVAALRALGCRAGVVNAGGDLRQFGAQVWHPVRVRLPHDLAQAPLLLAVRDAAVATSAYGPHAAGDTTLHDRRRGLPPRVWNGSVTVVAPNCALADALTKVVALRPQRAPSLLRRHRAQALRIDARGRATATLRHGDCHVRLALPT
jgi:FAD:protein FMN transferase